MFVAIIFILIIIGSVWFHIWSPWWWTPVASNWGNIDTTIVAQIEHSEMNIIDLILISDGILLKK